MYSLLLAIIYLAFISLGLPDSLLGAAWPVLYRQLDVPIAFAGILTFIISCGTVLSSLMSDRLTRRFGAGWVTAASVFMTMVALFGFSCSSAFWMLCLWAVPYGLGAGAVDAALNNYVALHYSQRHMHWLHCFWGVGVSISPYIMSSCLISGAGWQAGYRWVAILQAALTAILLASLPLWRSRKKSSGAEKEAAEPAAEALGVRGALRIPGVREVLVGFFCYCALESSTGLWASSYLVLNRGIAVEVAARWASLFYLGITFGRFLSGTIANKLTDRSIIRLGLALIFLGILAILFPAAPQIVPLCGLIVIGLGCAPVYPAIIHETPSNFGAENSQAVIGIQMAGAYVGATVMPPLFGIVADSINIGWYPVWLLLILVLMAVMLERKNRIVAAAGR
ncbi:MAG: MFS transporter [Victivallis vadensis]